MIEETRAVTTPDGDMSVVVTRPDGDGPFPVVVLFHHGPGLDGGTRRAMAIFSDAGYLVAAPDRYHRHGDLIAVDTAKLRSDPDSEEAKRFGEIFMSVTDEMVADDLAAVLADLAADPAGFRHSPRASHEWIDSPCSAMSNPLRSVSSVTRSGTIRLITFRITQVTTPDHTSTATMA